ncbi:hypothetical protein LTR94_031122, partial [Friedmanniomyces endolithicus]
DFVSTFAGATTFERELVSVGRLPMLIETVRALGAPQILEQMENGFATLVLGGLGLAEETALRVELGRITLNTAKRFGKARFAQIAARYANLATDLPPYIEQREAVEHEGNLLLTACPGSGKTRVILAKLLTLADQVVGTEAGAMAVIADGFAAAEAEYCVRIGRAPEPGRTGLSLDEALDL